MLYADYMVPRQIVAQVATYVTQFLSYFCIIVINMYAISYAVNEYMKQNEMHTTIYNDIIA